ncbi:MAG: HAMP domain-containing histidine kinase [Deltaproteobacteria bacterium]|nr:HAMP domain-containing histidine kinase [Deltaproteobacteria bacterium]
MDKRRTVLLLRSVVIFTTSYLVLFGGQPLTLNNVGYVALLIASNVAIALCPAWIINAPQFAPGLLLGDTALVLLGLYQTVGFSQEFLIVYFFTIFLTTAAETLAQIAIGATLVSGLYGYWLYVSTPGPMDASHWLRLPFFFVVAIFYAFLTDELKVEKRRREEAEREREHLRLLLQVAGAPPASSVASECLKGIGAFIESAFPNLRCAVSLELDAARADDGAIWLPIDAYNQHFGGVLVRSTRGAVTDTERTLCELVIHAVASAVYTARQVEAARESSRLKEEFISTLSHELRTPLHAILGYTDLIESVVESAADPLIPESVERLRANARRLHDLLEEMLGFASLRAGQLAPLVTPVELPNLLGELAGFTKDLLAGRPIDFEMDLPADLPPLLTDGVKLRQVLASLLSNATKFTERGQIRLSARLTAPEQVLITVSDTGIGIAPDNLQLIFDDFRQIDASTTRRFGGVGLGLALARGLLGVLGGTLDVVSRQGEGSTFRVALPLVHPLSRIDRRDRVLPLLKRREPEKTEWASA